MRLPVDYTELTWQKRREVREEYIRRQKGKCMYCKKPLKDTPVQDLKIDWSLFPEGFMDHPIHLQHDHETGLTEGAVHAYCNAVMWQYEGR